MVSTRLAVGSRPRRSAAGSSRTTPIRFRQTTRSLGGCGCRFGLLRYEANDLIEARREFEAGFVASSTFGGGLLVAWAVGYLALARQATGSPEAALEMVTRRLASCPHGRIGLAAQAAEIEARILLMQGDVGAAARWAIRRRRTSTSMAALDSQRQSRDVTIARVRLAQARPAEARSLLGAARTRPRPPALAELITIGVLEAAAAEATGRRADARRSLEAAVRLAAPGVTSSGSSTTAGASPTSCRSCARPSPAFVDG